MTNKEEKEKNERNKARKQEEGRRNKQKDRERKTDREKGKGDKMDERKEKQEKERGERRGRRDGGAKREGNHAWNWSEKAGLVSHVDGEALLSGGEGGLPIPISPSVVEGPKLLDEVEVG